MANRYSLERDGSTTFLTGFASSALVDTKHGTVASCEFRDDADRLVAELNDREELQLVVRAIAIWGEGTLRDPLDLEAILEKAKVLRVKTEAIDKLHGKPEST